jgi:hypothetical protein
MKTLPRSSASVLRAGFALVATAALLSPAALEGRQASTPSPIEVAAPNPEIEQAIELEARAWSMREMVDQRAQAARLYREAADLRPASDPAKVESLRNAALMNYYAGRLDRATRDATDAAHAALRQGDVAQAAHAYVDAAWMAAQDGNTNRAAELVEEARLLANSPLLPQAERSHLLARVADAE